jgi:hypothetical protein
MRTLRIRGQSWHLWLAQTFGWKSHYMQDVYENKGGLAVHKETRSVESDFCSYIRHVFLGVVVCLAAALAICIAVYSIGYTLYCIFEKIFRHVSIMGRVHDALCGIGGMVMAFAFMAFVFHYLPKWLIRAWDWIRNLQDEDKAFERVNRRAVREATKRNRKRLAQIERENNPSFLMMAYRSIKDKTCFKIEVD